MTENENSVNTGKESVAWKQESELKLPFSKIIYLFFSYQYDKRTRVISNVLLYTHMHKLRPADNPHDQYYFIKLKKTTTLPASSKDSKTLDSSNTGFVFIYSIFQPF
jgi:hypothetical protein